MRAARARAVLLAGVMAWLVVGAALVQTARATVPLVVDGSAGLDEGCAALASLAGLTVLAWLALAVLVTAWAARPASGQAPQPRSSSRLARIMTPAVLRRLVTVAVAGAIAAGGAPAQAASPDVPRGVVAGALDPGWAAPPAPTPPAGTLPERDVRVVPPPSSSRAAARPIALDPAWGGPGRVRPTVHPEEAVVVRRGDTLWDIAARHLGPAATDAEIAHAWPAWFAANRTTIGPDPDRLSPGQRLHPPTSRAGGLS